MWLGYIWKLPQNMSFSTLYKAHHCFWYVQLSAKPIIKNKINKGQCYFVHGGTQFIERVIYLETFSLCLLYVFYVWGQFFSDNLNLNQFTIIYAQVSFYYYYLNHITIKVLTLQQLKWMTGLTINQKENWESSDIPFRLRNFAWWFLMSSQLWQYFLVCFSALYTKSPFVLWHSSKSFIHTSLDFLFLHSSTSWETLLLMKDYQFLLL